MKNLTAALLLLGLGAFPLAACDSPCDKAFKKFEKCALKDTPEKSHAKLKEMLAATKDKFMKKCKKSESQIKACNKIDDCKKFMKCGDSIK